MGVGVMTNNLTDGEPMTQDDLTENNLLVSAIYPLRNIMMSDGSDAPELVSDIIDSEPKLVEGLAEFVESGWKQYGLTNEEGQPFGEFGDIEEWQQREMLSESAYRYVPDDLLIATVAAPVPKFRKGATGYSFSWGHTFTGFVAGSSVEELFRAAAAWKEARYEEEKKAA